MKREHALQLLSGCVDELRIRYGISELSLFGSVARDEAREDSDVDIMVSFPETPPFSSFMELKDDLVQRLKARVDLVTRTGLKPRIRPLVEREALRVA